MTDPRPAVLFVCTHDAGRSQLAATLVKLGSDDRILVRSAGSAPADAIDPAVITVMRELGVDLSTARPKPLASDAVEASDVVVTMGDACPVLPGKRYEEWQPDDPSGQDVETVRRIRDEIDRRVEALVGELAS